MEWISKHTSELPDWPDSEPGWVIGPSFDNDSEKEWQIEQGGYQSDPSEEKEFLLNYVAFVRDASGPFTNYDNKRTKYETDDGRYLYGPEAAKLISGAPDMLTALLFVRTRLYDLDHTENCPAPKKYEEEDDEEYEEEADEEEGEEDDCECGYDFIEDVIFKSLSRPGWR